MRLSPVSGAQDERAVKREIHQKGRIIKKARKASWTEYRRVISTKKVVSKKVEGREVL